jgi:tRNA nucleotidyltransferase/poly(A) polymerase
MMTPTLPDLPIFRTIAEAAHELGQPAYVIGGYVRDLALQRGSKDIDVVTVGEVYGALGEAALQQHHYAVRRPLSYAAAKMQFSTLRLPPSYHPHF